MAGCPNRDQHREEPQHHNRIHERQRRPAEAQRRQHAGQLQREMQQIGRIGNVAKESQALKPPTPQLLVQRQGRDGERAQDEDEGQQEQIVAFSDIEASNRGRNMPRNPIGPAMRHAGIIFRNRQAPARQRQRAQQARDPQGIATPLDPFGGAPYRAAQKESHQPAGDEFIVEQQQQSQRCRRQHVARPHQSRPAEAEKQDIEQRFDRHRPSRPVEKLLLGRRQPLLRHGEAGGETLPVAGVENEILPGAPPEPELQQRRQRQGCKIQRVEPRKAQQ